MADNRKIALYDPKKDSQPLILVPTSLLNGLQNLFPPLIT